MRLAVEEKNVVNLLSSFTLNRIDFQKFFSRSFRFISKKHFLSHSCNVDIEKFFIRIVAVHILAFQFEVQF